MSEQPTPLKRLAAEIRRLKEAAGGFKQLGKETRVDRRKLSKLANGVDVPLTIAELTTLNEFFTGRGQGLAAAFSPAGVVRQIAEHGEVAFLVGSQPDEAYSRIDFSRWDIRSLRSVLQSLNATGKAVRFELEDVIWRKDAAEHFGPGVQVHENEAWHRLLEDTGPSIVGIGSPKACHASEVMLGEMLKVEPFSSWPEGKLPPFFFVWPDDDSRAAETASAFKRLPSEIKNLPGATAALIESLRAEGSRSCAAYDGAVHGADRRGGSWDTYGIIAAQRRPGNQIWVLLMGVTGPGTLGAAKALGDFAADLEVPPDSPSKCSPTVWTLVRTTVEEHEKERNLRRDTRHVVGYPDCGPNHAFHADRQR